MPWLIKQELKLGQSTGTNGQCDVVVVDVEVEQDIESYSELCIVLYLFFIFISPFIDFF